MKYRIVAIRKIVKFIFYFLYSIFYVLLCQSKSRITTATQSTTRPTVIPILVSPNSVKARPIVYRRSPIDIRDFVIILPVTYTKSAFQDEKTQKYLPRLAKNRHRPSKSIRHEYYTMIFVTVNPAFGGISEKLWKNMRIYCNFPDFKGIILIEDDISFFIAQTGTKRSCDKWFV